MKLGMIGLGRMGGNMTERLLNDGHEVVVFDPDSAAVNSLVSKGASASSSLANVVGQLNAPRTVWVMVPSGDITEQAVNGLVELLGAGVRGEVWVSVVPRGGRWSDHRIARANQHRFGMGAK